MTEKQHEIIINLALATLLIVSAVTFFIKSFLERQSRPERWQRGLWFVFGFLLSPFSWLFVIFVVPAMLLAALFVSFLRSPRAKKALYFSLGAAAGATLCVVWLGLLNTFAMPQH